jgi:hypothetical protein
MTLAIQGPITRDPGPKTLAKRWPHDPGENVRRWPHVPGDRQRQLAGTLDAATLSRDVMGYALSAVAYAPLIDDRFQPFDVFSPAQEPALA